MADGYDLAWDPRDTSYHVTHVWCRNGDELRWSERGHEDERKFRYWRELPTGFLGIKPCERNRPRVIMATFGSYSDAVRAIGNYPSGGPYA